MKDKKNIVYLIIAIILFIGTLAFCLKVYFFDNDNNRNFRSFKNKRYR